MSNYLEFKKIYDFGKTKLLLTSLMQMATQSTRFNARKKDASALSLNQHKR